MSKRTLIRLLSIVMIVTLLAASLVSLAVPTSAAEEFLTYRKGGNDASSYYKKSKYYTQLNSLPKTGDDATNVVSVAFSQLGYFEGDTESAFDGTSGVGSGNYCEMNWNLGGGIGYGYYWCASFVTFCLFQGRATNQATYNELVRFHYDDPDYIWKEISCTAWIRNLKVADCFEWSAYQGGNYKPQTGDIIFYTWSMDPSDGADHTGVVAYSDDKYVYTVEGNTSSGSGLDDNGDGVYFKQYSLNSGYIYGYGTPPYKNQNADEAIDFSGKNPTPGTYVNAYYKGRYIYADEACTSSTNVVIPKYTQFKVTDVVKTYNSGEVNSVLKVEYNGTVGYVTDYDDGTPFRFVQLSSSGPSIPDAPTVASITDTSLTLDIIKNCEYKMDDGQWQSSPIFKNLSTDKTYKFYQRYKDAESSEALTVNFGDLVKQTKLKSITIAGVDFNFDPATKSYNIKLPDTLTAVPKVTAEAEVYTSTVSVTTGKIVNKQAMVTVSLTPKTLEPVYYTIFFSFVPEADLETEKPIAPVLNTFTNTSITLFPVDGYEYKVEGGEWQDSNVFENLSENKTYKFTQRIKGNTAVSEELSLRISNLLVATQIQSLTFDIPVSSLTYNPDTMTYSVALPAGTTAIPGITALPAVATTTVEVTVGDIVGNIGTARVDLQPQPGPKTSYTIEFTFASAPAASGDTTPSDTTVTTPSDTTVTTPSDTTVTTPSDTTVTTPSDTTVTTPSDTTVTTPSDTTVTTPSDSSTGTMAPSGTLAPSATVATPVATAAPAKGGCQSSTAVLAVMGVVGILSVSTFATAKKRKDD